MHDTLGNYLAGGIVDRDWRIDARRLGINLAAGTAAKFGAKSIGDWRKDSILGSDNPFVDYVMHKALHGGLAAGVATATARMDHLKGTERQKHIVGAASGAMMAEVVSEYMMGAAIRRMEEKLTASGHAPSSQAYADLRRSLLADEFKTIRTVAQLSVVALAESLKVDLNAAMNAANNALDKNALPLLAAAVFVGRAGKVAWDAYKLYRAARTVSNEIMSLEEFMAQREGAQMDADPEAGKPHVESFPEEESRAQSFSTPAYDSGPQVHSTPIHDQSSSSDKGFDRHDGPDASIFTSDRKDNCSKGESPIWKAFKPYRGIYKTDGENIYKWDFTHNDIEVFNKKGRHLGSMDPKTGDIYKPAVKPRIENF